MKGLKNLSLFISILVIFFAILIILSFFGNPISKGVVKVKAYNYLKENCSDYEAKSIEIVYDLVNSSYLVNVYDSGSEEIEFTLVYNYFGCFKKKVSRNISLNKESVGISLPTLRVKTNPGIFSWVCLFLLNLIKFQIFYVFL